MLEREDITYFDNENVGAEADFNNLETSITIYVDDIIFGATNNDLCKYFEKLIKDKFQMSLMGELTFFLGLQVKQKKDGIFISQDKYVAEILEKFGLTEGKSASTPIDTEKPLLKDPDGKNVDVHIYRSMIGSLMYLTSSRPDIMFAVCACVRFQVTPKASHLHVVKRIFRYLKGKPRLGLWYPKNSPFDLVAYSDSDYAGASLDRKSTTGGCQFLRCRLISWQCKKQIVVATSSTEAEYVAGASCCTQVLWIQNQMLDYGQWKFLIHTNLQSMSAKCTSWNEFSSAMASAVICLSTGRKFNFSKYIFDSLVRDVDSNSKFYIYPRFIHLIIQNQLGDLSTHTTKYISPTLTQKVIANMRRVGKGCSGIETPLFEGMFVARELEEQGDTEEQGNADNAAEEPTRVKKLERANKVKTLKLRRLRKVGTSKRIESSDDTIMKDVSKQERIIDELDKDEGAVLMSEKEEKEIKEVKDNTGDAQVEGRQAGINQIDMDHAAKVLSVQEDEPEVQEVVKVVITAKLIIKVVAAIVVPTITAAVVPTVTTAVVPTVTAAPVKVDVPSTRQRRGVVIRDPEEESSSKTTTETKSKDKGKGIMVEEPKPMKKKQQVKLDEAYARKLHEERNQDIDWEVAIDHVKQKAKENPYVQRYQVMKKRPQTEAQARRNMMSKEQIEEEENRAIESINETPTQKAAKRRRLNEEAEDVEELKQYLEILPDEDDHIYTEATLLARKVHVVDYQIIQLNNKPHLKIIRADETHQLYVSFITLLKNFDREDLESLWSIVKKRFSTLKPNNFSDDFLLTTLRAMFGRQDGKDQVWMSQRSVHGQAKNFISIRNTYCLLARTITAWLSINQSIQMMTSKLPSPMGIKAMLKGVSKGWRDEVVAGGLGVAVEVVRQGDVDDGDDVGGVGMVAMVMWLLMKGGGRWPESGRSGAEKDREGKCVWRRLEL
nr:uncharacterized mitochondrial protein AtMg00810-like [Tanacetum cinerariifolium]